VLPIGPAREGTVVTTLAKSLGCYDVAEHIPVICARRADWTPSVQVRPALGGSKSIHRNLSNFVRQCRSAQNYDEFPRRSKLALVVEEGIVKSEKRKPSYDASQTYEFKKYGNITLKKQFGSGRKIRQSTQKRKRLGPVSAPAKFLHL